MSIFKPEERNEIAQFLSKNLKVEHFNFQVGFNYSLTETSQIFNERKFNSISVSGLEDFKFRGNTLEERIQNALDDFSIHCDKLHDLYPEVKTVTVTNFYFW